jgi:predicted RNA-binding protein (virulence factor B family)
MTPNFQKLKETVAPDFFTPWQEIEAEILTYTDLGINVAINNEYIGLVYKNEIFGEYPIGTKLTAYIKAIREDGRIDISFQPNQGKHIFLTADKILAYLKANGGKSKFNDKSAPESIREAFQISKIVFKRALSVLYKQGKIIITDQGIELV